MNNEEKRQLIIVNDLVLAIAKTIEFSSPKDEVEHQTILATGVVTYLNQWLDFLGVDKKTKLKNIRALAVAVMHAANTLEELESGKNISDEDVN